MRAAPIEPFVHPLDSHMKFPWPSSFDRVPDAPWAQQPVEALALNYDTVENHGWYSNLDYTYRL